MKTGGVGMNLTIVMKWKKIEKKSKKFLNNRNKGIREYENIDFKGFPKSIKEQKYASMMAEYFSMNRHPYFIRSGHQIILNE